MFDDLFHGLALQGIHSALDKVSDRSGRPLEDSGNDSEDKLVRNGPVEDGEDFFDSSLTHNSVVSLHK